MLHIFVISLTAVASCAAAMDSVTVVDMFTKVVNLCQQKSNASLITCMKERSLIALDHVYRSKNDISIIPNIIFLSKYSDANGEDRSAKLLQQDINNEAPQNKSAFLDSMIVKKFYDFLESRAISIRVPISSLDFLHLLPAAESEKAEGRGFRKKDKGNNMMAMGAMMMGTMMAMKLAAVAAIAGKALIASMMAILLSAVAALSKKGHTHGSTYEVINVPTNGHHARRSIASEASSYTNQNHPTQFHRVESLVNEPIDDVN